MQSRRRSRPNPRLIAFQILNALETEHSNSTLLLQQRLSSVLLPADRRLITELVLGTLRWRGKLLFWIQAFSSRRLEQLDRQVCILLQLGIYQLCFTEIPQHAAIHETVAVCKRIRLTSAASFVNGILRAVQGKMGSMPEPSSSEIAESLSIQWSHPLWLVRRWLDRFGRDETVELMKRNNEPSRLYLRVNELLVDPETLSRRLLSEEIQTEPTAFSSLMLSVLEGAPQHTRTFADGKFYIQDPAVEILGSVISPLPGSTILEIAAAPGGKTFQLAVRMKGNGRILSVDSEIARMKLWRKNMDRMRIHCADPIIADARFLPLQGMFDQVVVDAPCSSLGVIGRHPEIRWWRSEEELQGFSSLQLRILESCSNHVRVQGELIYSVCSFEPEETSEVVESFLRVHHDFANVNQLFLFPHRDGTDGFFIAKLKRK